MTTFIGTWAPRHLAGLFFGILVLAFFSALAGCGSNPLMTDGPPVFYPPPPHQPRIQYLFGFTAEGDLEGTSDFEEFIVGAPDQQRTLVKPYGVTMVGHSLYVTDFSIGDVAIIDLDEREFRLLCADQTQKLSGPLNLFLTPDGHKFVADATLMQVVEFDERDWWVRSFGVEGQFKPTDVAVTETLIYVADVQDHEIEVLDRVSGEVLYKIGKKGQLASEFLYPTNLALDSDDNLYVTDTFNNRVQKFDPQGNFLGMFGSLGDRPGSFTRPKGIAVDPSGLIFVVDAAFANVQVFSKDFELLMFFGGGGVAPGALNLPTDVEVFVPDNLTFYQEFADPNLSLQSILLVISQYGPRRVNVYGFGEWTGPMPAALPTSAPAVEGQPPELAPEPILPLPVDAVEPGVDSPKSEDPADIPPAAEEGAPSDGVAPGDGAE